MPPRPPDRALTNVTGARAGAPRPMMPGGPPPGGGMPPRPTVVPTPGGAPGGSPGGGAQSPVARETMQLLSQVTQNIKKEPQTVIPIVVQWIRITAQAFISKARASQGQPQPGAQPPAATPPATPPLAPASAAA